LLRAAAQQNWCDALINGASHYFVAAHKIICHIALTEFTNTWPTHGESAMTTTADFTRQAEDMMKAAKDMRIPDNVQAFAQEGVQNSHKAFVKVADVAKESAKAAEEVMLKVQSNAKTIGEKVLHNTTSNTEAAFAAASEIMKAKTLPEAARLQAEFMKNQFSVAGAQTQELFKLSTELAKSAFDQMNAATAKTMEQAKKGS
jgi:hypothetical protein